MNCCHVKNQCLVIRLPKEIDHCQAEQIRQECERSFMNFIIRDIIFDFSGIQNVVTVLDTIEEVKEVYE